MKTAINAGTEKSAVKLESCWLSGGSTSPAVLHYPYAFTRGANFKYSTYIIYIMFENVKIAWQYFKESWHYIRTNPKILKIPFVAMGLWLLIVFPLFLVTLFELWFLVITGSSSIGIIFIVTLIIDAVLLWFFTYLVSYVYTGMIVAAVYASEIGRKEGYLDNLKGNWGALAKFAVLNMLFTGALSAAGSAMRGLSEVVQLIGKVGISIVAWVYRYLTIFTICAIVIEEMKMSRALKRSVELVRRKPVVVLFGMLMSDLIGVVVVIVIFASFILFLSLGFFLASIYGENVLIWCIMGWFLFFLIVGLGSALIISLVTNVYYAKVYLDMLKEEGSPLYRETLSGYAVMYDYDEPAMQAALKSSYITYDRFIETVKNSVEWWEEKLSNRVH